jgi:hypothetical protein
MGTNYYAVKKKPSEYNNEIHIGKSSGGWRFLFQGYSDELTINSKEDWEKFLKNDEYVIMDEYGSRISYKDFFKLVEDKQKENNKDNFAYAVNRNGYRFSYNDFI